MAFNLGANGLVTKFPAFTKAIKNKDWLKAAKESHRSQVGARRNRIVRQWLEGAYFTQPGDWNLPRGRTRIA
jgi:GH24 family phage-related lysozyme (muramidase)